VRHPPLDALTILTERSQHAVRRLLDDLYLTDAGQIDPFAIDDVIRQCLEVTLNGFAHKYFGEIASLSGDVSNTLCVIHSASPDLSVSN
jgi:hypothetical protein